MGIFKIVKTSDLLNLLRDILVSDMAVTRYGIHTRKGNKYNSTAIFILNNDVGVPWQSSVT